MVAVICDHEVGAGKTLIMCTAAYEMKRLGLANKPLIIGLKANVFDIADTFRKAYPNAKILYPGKNDFNKQNPLLIAVVTFVRIGAMSFSCSFWISSCII